MKKTYINPTLLVVNVQPTQLLALSRDGEYDSEHDTVLSKGGWSWDDDEPVDYEE